MAHDSSTRSRYGAFVDKNTSVWFAHEILPYEAALMRYLARICPRGEDIVDLRQDIYVKVYEAAKIQRPTLVRPFLFAIARNLVIDRLRRRRIVSIEPTGDAEVLNVILDELSPERRISARQELKALSAAFAQLPPKCREVVWLRKVDEVPQAEVARLMGISPRTVEFHVQKGMRLLARCLFGESIGQEPQELEESEGESKHGK